VAQIDAAFQEIASFGLLRDELDVLLAHVPARQPVAHRVLIADVPHSDRTSAHIRGAPDAGGAAAHHERRRALEHLRDVDGITAAGAERQRVGQPGDRDVGRAVRQHLQRVDRRGSRDRRSALDEFDRDPLTLVEAERVGHVVAGKLGLVRPLQLQAHDRQFALRAAHLRPHRRGQYGEHPEDQQSARSATDARHLVRSGLIVAGPSA
jgi:hypothetical protein